MVVGLYPDIRNELNRRGWVEHVKPPEGEKFNTIAFHLMYTTKSKDCFTLPYLAPFQHVNHFEGAKALTTKVGLTHNMKNLIWKQTIDVDASFP